MVLFTDIYLSHVSIQFRKFGIPRVALKFFNASPMGDIKFDSIGSAAN